MVVVMYQYELSSLLVSLLAGVTHGLHFLCPVQDTLSFILKTKEASVHQEIYWQAPWHPWQCSNVLDKILRRFQPVTSKLSAYLSWPLASSLVG